MPVTFTIAWATPQPLAVSRIADVASKDVAIGESPSGNVLLLPVGALVTRNSVQARIIGQTAHPLDDWRFARDVRVAKFGGGDLLATAEDVQEIENDIARATERLAQVGISLNVTVADLQTFPGSVNVAGSSIPLDLSDGLEFNSGQADTPELSAFLTHAASIVSETALKVFYISNLVGEIPEFGTEVPPGFAVSEGPFENIVVICRRRYPFVLAHELGHRLTDSGSHDFNANNLMRSRPHVGNRIDHPKRLSDSQHRAIISSPLLDAP